MNANSLLNLQKGRRSKHPNKLANLKLGGFKKGYTPHNKGKQDQETHTWKGDDAGYAAVHIWVAKKLGKPSECTNCHISGGNPRKYHWHNINGKYLRDTSDWLRLCAKCHKLIHKGG